MDGRRHQWELNIDETSEVILGRGGHPNLARCWPCCASDGPESHAVSDTTEISKRLGSKAPYFLFERHSWIPGTNATDSTEMGHQSFSATVQYSTAHPTSTGLQYSTSLIESMYVELGHAVSKRAFQYFLSTPALLKESLLPLQSRNVSTRLFLLHAPFLPSDVNQRSPHARRHLI